MEKSITIDLTQPAPEKNAAQAPMLLTIQIHPAKNKTDKNVVISINALQGTPLIAQVSQSEIVWPEQIDQLITKLKGELDTRNERLKYALTQNAAATVTPAKNNSVSKKVPPTKKPTDAAETSNTEQPAGAIEVTKNKPATIEVAKSENQPSFFN